MEYDKFRVFSHDGTFDRFLEIENGSSSFLARDGEYTAWSVGQDESTGCTIMTSKTFNVTSDMRVSINESDTVPYTIDASELIAEHGPLTNLSVESEMSKKIVYDDRVYVYEEFNLRRFADTRIVRFSESPSLNVSVEYLMVPKVYNNGTNKEPHIDSPVVYHLIYPTIGVNGPKTFQVNKNELGDEKCIYYRTHQNQTYSISHAVFQNIWDNWGDHSYLWDIKDCRLQNIYLTPEYTMYYSSTSDSRYYYKSKWELRGEYLYPSTGETYTNEVNRHPYTGELLSWNISNYYGFFFSAAYQADQPPVRSIYEILNANNTIIVKRDGEVIHNDANYSWSLVAYENYSEIEPGTNFEVSLIGRNPYMNLSTRTLTEFGAQYDPQGDDIPPKIENVHVAGLDTENSVSSGDIEVYIDVIDNSQVIELNVSYSPGAVDKSPEEDESGWLNAPVIRVNETRFKADLDASNYNGTINLEIYAQDSNKNWMRTLTFDAFYVKEVQKITVDNDGEADYITIQEAVDNANDGDKIVVYPGTYTENVVVNKELTIISESGNPDNTIVRAADPNNHVFHVTSDNVKISSFSIRDAASSYNGALQMGVNLNGVTDCNISNNRLFSNNVGIFLYDSKSNTLTNNIVYNNNYGIFVPISNSNMLSNNVAYNNNRGIYLQGSNYNTLNNNTANWNNFNGIELRYSSNYNTVINNTVSNNPYGIDLYSSSNNTITNNTASNNTNNGISLSYSSYNTVIDNVMSNNTGSGISLRYSNYNLIYNNHFNNTANTDFSGTNTGNVWNTTKTEGMNIMGGSYLGGNYWLTPTCTGFSQINVDTDGDGFCDETYTIASGHIDYLPLAVLGVNNPPAATISSITPNPAVEGVTVTFNGSGTDSDGTIAGYNWTSSLDGQLSSSVNFSTSILSIGTHTINFSVQDDDGAWSETDLATVTINEKPNVAPIASIDSITPNPAVEGKTVTFNGSGTDSDGTITGYNWTSSLDGQLSSSVNFSTSGLSIGTNSINFSVQDDDGAWSDADSAIVTINEIPNVAPIASIDSITPNPAVEGETVTFNGSGTDSDGTITGYNWTSSLDGQLSSSVNFSTSGLSTSTHSISFSVQDDGGTWLDAASATVTINEKPKISNNGGSSSSSSGGGGSGATGETFENIALKNVKAENIVDGLEISYVFDEEQNAIQYVNFSALRNYGRVSATIEVLEKRSSMVDESAPGVVYSNLNIWVGRSGFATESNIAHPVIGFSVSKARLTENGINENAIALYRHSEGKWNTLDTQKVGDDDSYIYFEAKTPGFSPFAIAAEADDEILTDNTTSEEEFSNSVNDTEPIEEEIPVTESNSIPGISIFTSVFILVFACLFRKRKN